MANLKEIRSRISSVQSTRQITSAMKMVSAAKLRKAQDSIMQMRPYAEKLQQILESVSRSLENDIDNVYGTKREIKKVLLVVVTSNRGLCGAFNANVIKETERYINEDYRYIGGRDMVHILPIGKKGHDYFKGKKYKVLENQSSLFDNLDFEHILPIVNSVMKDYLDEKYDKVEIIYNQFINAAVQSLQIENFLPINLEEMDGEEHKIEKTLSNYIFEPDKDFIIKELIPKSLRTQFFKAVLDSHAAEHGARMTAMHKATDNATELIKELSLNYNKARQASITNEILEIVGGAEALKIS